LQRNEQARQKMTRLGAGRRNIGAQDDALDAQNDVECEHGGTRGAHDFAQAPAQPVAVDSATHHLSPDDVADAAGRLCGRGRDQLQVLPVMTGTVPEYRLERAGAAKTIPGGPSGRRRSRNERQTASRARPLARRAERTLRPPTVFMRARNPCVRARRIFDGW
jgi:hypothetical protein